MATFSLVRATARDAVASSLSCDKHTKHSLSHSRAVDCCRYVFRNGLLGSVRGSPASKIGTLSKESVLLLNSVQASLDNNWAHDINQVRREVDLSGAQGQAAHGPACFMSQLESKKQPNKMLSADQKACMRHWGICQSFAIVS